MIKVLICGKDSYIGKAFIAKMAGTFKIDELDLQTEKWRDFDFSKYDVLIHLAAIVHRTDIKDEELYFRVNSDLPIDVAKTAVNQGLKHFIFFSTMAVYGISPSLRGEGRISIDSRYNPINLYPARLARRSSSPGPADYSGLGAGRGRHRGTGGGGNCS